MPPSLARSRRRAPTAPSLGATGGRSLFRRLVARLEALAPWKVVALGVLSGVVAGGLWLIAAGSPFGFLGGVAMLAGALLLGWRSAPVFPVADPPLEELLEMVELEGGTFLMGSPDSDGSADLDEKPQHGVTVSPFGMAKFVVTRKLYRDVMAKQPTEWEPDGGDGFMPANHLSWLTQSISATLWRASG